MFYSGIQKLDGLVGVVDEGRIILIETVGDLGVEIAMSFMKDALKRDYQVFIVVSEGKEKDVRKSLSNYIDSVNLITSGKSFTFQELYTISLITRGREEKIGLIKILQPLLTIHEPKKVYNLFLEMVENLRKSDVTVIFTIDKKLVDDRILAMFENDADIVIEIEELIENFKIKRGIRVKKSPNMPPSDFYELEINKEIRIGDKIGGKT